MESGSEHDKPPIAVLLEDPRLPYPYQTGGFFNAVDRDGLERLKRALGELPGHRFEFFDRHDTLASELAARRPRFAFNLCDTGFRNQGELEAHIPAMLEMLEIPYSGAGPAGLLLCRDKALVRSIAAQLGVPVPAERYLEGDDPAVLEEFPYPAILKPNFEEGSRGITAESLVDGPPAAATRLRALQRELPGRPLLLQEFLGGAEYCVGLIGNPELDLTLLPINEVDFDGLDPDLPRLLAFGFKNDPESRYWSQVRYRQAALEPAAAAELESHSRRLFARLGCRDYARIDYRADGDGRIKLLEVNPNPAWFWHGSLHMMALAAGHDYPEFLGLLLEAALARTAAHARGWRSTANQASTPPPKS